VHPVHVDGHIVLAVATFGLLTIADVAGLAVFLQERALKAKRPNALTWLLPGVGASEALELLTITHKTLLSLAAFSRPSTTTSAACG
jgi:ABC-type uncharacterized transport system permease subunit